MSHGNSKNKERIRGKVDRKKNLSYTLCPMTMYVQFKPVRLMSDRMVMYNVSNSEYNIINSKETQPAQNKTPENVLLTMRRHIGSFPKVESHYCHVDSKREYLEVSLNLRQLYRIYIKKNSNVKRSNSFLNLNTYKYLTQNIKFHFIIPVRMFVMCVQNLDFCQIRQMSSKRSILLICDENFKVVRAKAWTR